jgi:hypothetical protein
VYSNDGEASQNDTIEMLFLALRRNRLITYISNRIRCTASILGADPITDVTVLEIIWNVPKLLPLLTIGSPPNLEVGESNGYW